MVNEPQQRKWKVPARAHFEIFQGLARTLDTERLWYWRFRNRNGVVIADGAEGYDSRANAVRAARRFKFLAPISPIDKGYKTW